MKNLEEILQNWEQDTKIDITQISRELVKIPLLHSKYLTVLSRHRQLSKKAYSDFISLKKIKWEWITGKLSRDELKDLGWEQFPFVLKSDTSLYLESDKDLIKLQDKKVYHDEIMEVCKDILGELKSRTYQLRAYIDNEKFLNGA